MRIRDGHIAGQLIRRPLRRGITVVASLGLVAALATGVAAADEDQVPSEQEVESAREAADAKARDVAAVQADMVIANQRLQRSAIAAGQAAEAYNGAVWRLQQAREAARAAERRSARATRAVERQQGVYGEALASAYQMAPELTALSAMIDQDGVRGVAEQAATMQNAESALSAKYDEFRATSTLATVASQQAADARATAASAKEEANSARAAAAAAADAAAAEAAAVAGEKDALIAELAALQGISAALAEQRQSALEQQAAQAAADAAAAAASQEESAAQAQAPSQQSGSQSGEQAGDQAPGQPSSPPANQPAPEQPAPAPTPTPTPTPPPTPTPTPTPPPAPAPTPTPPPPSSGAQAAIAFAKKQIGKPYRWGAAGPSAWDCSGLTMKAWAQGGKSLPHYSVAQYDRSTPIKASALRPGDLVFWGSSSRSSSIYHVALYIGNGQIIHAPRTGRPVAQESMYYWIPPNFYARP